MKKLSVTILLIFALLLPLFAEEGIASWYTADKADAVTANGEKFDNTAFTAAHKTLKFGTRVRITSLEDGKSAEVRINDRGPYVDGRIIDVTPAVARQLGFYEDGIARVSVDVIYEPEEPETKYISGADTGWYTLQIGTYTNMSNAYDVYRNLLSQGLKPFLEIINGSMLRISVTNIQTYRLEDVKKSLAAIGITEPLVKGARNPYN